MLKTIKENLTIIVTIFFHFILEENNEKINEIKSIKMVIERCYMVIIVFFGKNITKTLFNIKKKNIEYKVKPKLIC